ncbi:hypothetical protein Aph01nite_43680 [Acrocarpospora phusangensis]|uniref:Scaffolding protein n=1 Tax=Acrocarpospora phusangensis TaxID=1070424 RepID=A0A919UQ53_9ACTN|nr:phage scaffolding protein [Acrocarpospora phusangensis]GIH26058.1 hypothetical protein Aph01nite_43680 [Acrocarpospora phusangensis]
MDCTNTQPKTLPVHPWTGLRALAVMPSGRVMWPVVGGSGDDDPEGDPEADPENDPEADPEGDPEADPQEDPDEGKKPKPAKGDTVPRSELAKVIAARDEAKKKLRERDRELEDLRRQGETAEETARREAAEEARKTADARYKPISVRAALLEAGVLPSRVKGALKLVDLEQVDVDEDGEVSGLDGQLASLKEEWPELFEAPKGDGKPEPRRPPSRGADGADRKPPSKKPPTASELQAAKLLGKAV